MKELYFDRTTNRFVINPNTNTIRVEIDPSYDINIRAGASASIYDDIVTEYYMTDFDEKSGGRFLWSFSYTCQQKETDFDLIDYVRNTQAEQYKIDLSIYKLINVTTSIYSYYTIMSMLERDDNKEEKVQDIWPSKPDYEKKKVQDIWEG